MSQTLTQSKVVQIHDLASSLGSGKADVFSTPMMIAFMEQTAEQCIANDLPQGDITVGTLVNIKHLAAAPLGATVTCQAQLLKQEGSQYVFDVKVWHNNKLLGEGIHHRAKVNKERFEKRVNNE